MARTNRVDPDVTEGVFAHAGWEWWPSEAPVASGPPLGSSGVDGLSTALDDRLWAVMADFSLAAYSSSFSAYNNVIAQPGESLAGSWTALPLVVEGAALVDGVYTKFNAAALVARSGNSAVISFRGTDDLIDGIEDVLTMVPSALHLQPLMLAFDQYVAAQGISKVYVTGHSLGGALAQLYMMMHADTAATRYESVTVGAPGFNFDLITNLVAAGFALAGLSHDERVVHLENAGDVVPDLLAKIGTTVHINEQGLGINPLTLHSSELYQAAAHFLVEEMGMSALPAPLTELEVLVAGAFDNGAYEIGAGDDQLVDYDLAFDFAYIAGGPGDDELGGTGANTLVGGKGDDIYRVEDAGDTVIERPGEGFDEVRTEISYTLPSEVDDLRLAEDSAFAWFDANIDGTGNALANILRGNAAANRLAGQAGNDSIVSGAGADTLEGGEGDDVLFASDGNDQLAGGAGSDYYVVDRLYYDVPFISFPPRYDISDEQGGQDVLQIDDIAAVFYHLDSFTDLTFSRRGNDLWIDLDLAVLFLPTDDDEGRIVIHDMASPEHRLETLLLVDRFGVQLGGAVSLVSAWFAVQGFGDEAQHRLSLSGVSGAYGELLFGSAGSLWMDTAAAGTGALLLNWVNGSTDADSLTGGPGNDGFNPGAGNDTMAGLAGNDFLSADYDGDHDTFDGGAGDDTVNINAIASGNAAVPTFWTFGGNPATRLDAASSRADIEARLGPVAAVATLNIPLAGGGSAPQISVSNVENLNVLGGSDSADLLFVRGAGGIYRAGEGNDTFYADFSAFGGDLVWRNEPQAGDQVLANGITVEGIERLIISTGAGNDVVSNLQAAGSDDIATGAGNDFIDGGPGNDRMAGGLGDDQYVIDNLGDAVVELPGQGFDTVRTPVSLTLPAEVEAGVLLGEAALNATGNAADNRFEPNRANNVIDGGAGNDTAVYTNAPAAVAVDLALGRATGGSGTDTLLNIENAIGSAFNDSLLGNAAVNRLEGGAGGDVLNGGAGADTLVGGPGSDNFYIDNLGDVALETDASAAGGVDTVYTSANIAALGANIENIRLLGSGAVNVVGNGLNNVLYANAGDNVLDGASGNDTASYVYAGAGVSVSLALTTAQATGGSGSDILRAIEYLVGSPYNDSLSGNAGFNSLDGGAGADTLSGGAADDNYTVDNAGDVVIETDPAPGFGGIDTVYASVSTTLSANVENLRLVPATALNGTGNSLNNTLYAGNGNNLLDGAAGIDLASYAFATSAVSVSLANAGAQATGGSGSDTLTRIEGLIGSAFNDNLSGSTGNDLLYGGAGVDTLSGGAGLDVLDGQAGADSMVGGDGGDNYTIDDVGDLTVESNASAATGGIDTAYTYVSHTLQANVENARILTPGAANLSGNALDNVIYAGRGDNTVDGGAGNDTVTYLYQLGGVNVSLAITGPQNTLGSGTDTLSNLENLTGTNFADNLTGTAGANILDGGLGADILIGGDGSDLYLVDNPADNLIETNANPATGGIDLVYTTATYTLGANVENLRQTGTGNINATGNGLNNLLYAGAGNNVLDGQSGSDTVSFVFATAGVTASLATGQATGGSGSDTLSNVENLIGSNFADTLSGDAQANTLTGGIGADVFVLNSLLASDTISDFVSGSDKVRISQAGIAIGNGDATVNNAATIAGPGGFATTAELVLVTANVAGAISASTAAASIGSASSAYAVGLKALFVVDNGSSSAAYLFTAADANAAISAAELTLLATLSSVPATIAADWVFGG